MYSKNLFKRQVRGEYIDGSMKIHMRNLPFAFIMEKNSFFVFMFSLNMPSTADVVNSAVLDWVPLANTQVCIAFITTPTPFGANLLLISSRIWYVSLSCS